MHKASWNPIAMVEELTNCWFLSFYSSCRRVFYPFAITFCIISLSLITVWDSVWNNFYLKLNCSLYSCRAQPFHQCLLDNFQGQIWSPVLFLIIFHFSLQQFEIRFAAFVSFSISPQIFILHISGSELDEKLLFWKVVGNSFEFIVVFSCWIHLLFSLPCNNGGDITSSRIIILLRTVLSLLLISLPFCIGEGMNLDRENTERVAWWLTILATKNDMWEGKKQDLLPLVPTVGCLYDMSEEWKHWLNIFGQNEESTNISPLR